MRKSGGGQGRLEEKEERKRRRKGVGCWGIGFLNWGEGGSGQ